MTELVSLNAPYVRTLPALDFREVETSESGRFLKGRAVPYDTWADVGFFMEQHAPGSFAKSIREAAEKLPLLLWHNNRTFPIGVSHEWDDNAEGLDCVWRLDEKDDRALEAARKAEDGFLAGLSIGFAPISEPSKSAGTLREDDNGTVWVRWTESRLLEVSLTPTPAFAGARVQLVRSRNKFGGEPRRSAEIDGWRRYLETAREGAK